jgi:tRNA (guanine37-N1)-methyltransferase
MTKGHLIKGIVEELYGKEMARIIWSRLDIVGDIAIIKKPFNVDLEALRPLAEALVERIPYVKSVWAAAGPVEGEFRTRKLVHLAGEHRSETVYKEHGCTFKVDICKVFITPRLSFEHLRVAKLVKPGETVVNMYAGVGTFSIIIAKHGSPRKVYSIDINPDAYRLMVENVALNGVEDVVVPILGDAAEVVTKPPIAGSADRVLMPLPELALKHLPSALKALRDRGTLHIYLHVFVPRGSDPREEAVKAVRREFEELGVRSYNLTHARVVRSVGPRRAQVVLDVEVYKEQ